MRPLLFAIFGLFMLSAQAVDPCASPGESWSCYGVMDMRWKSNGESGQARITRFNNGELLAEVSGADGRKRMLQVPASGRVLYFGLSDLDAGSDRSPFAFLDYGFAVPALAMQAAFPDGPGSVPSERVQKDVSVEGKPCRLSIVRPARGAILFRLEASDAQGIEFTGTWNGTPARALPDSYSLSGWTHGAECRLATLRDARSPECPPAAPGPWK